MALGKYYEEILERRTENARLGLNSQNTTNSQKLAKGELGEKAQNEIAQQWRFGDSVHRLKLA